MTFVRRMTYQLFAKILTIIVKCTMYELGSSSFLMKRLKHRACHTILRKSGYHEWLKRRPSAEKKRSLAGRKADIQRAIIYSVIDFWRHRSAHSDFQANFCTAGLAPLWWESFALVIDTHTPACMHTHTQFGEGLMHRCVHVHTWMWWCCCWY